MTLPPERDRTPVPGAGRGWAAHVAGAWSVERAREVCPGLGRAPGASRRALSRRPRAADTLPRPQRRSATRVQLRGARSRAAGGDNGVIGVASNQRRDLPCGDLPLACWPVSAC